MSKIKLKYKKDLKVFVPDKDVDLPDNYEILIENPVITTDDYKLQEYIKKVREDIVRNFYNKYGIDLSSDSFLEIIGSEAEYLSNTTYEDDKIRIIEAVTEKHKRGYNAS